MAIIGKIRSYSGLLIAIVGVGLAAFVLGDLFQYGPRRGDDILKRMKVGKVEGTTIIYPEFDDRVNQYVDNWKQRTGESSVGEQQMFQIRQQVWNDLKNEILFEKEIEKIGIAVTSEELLEMIVGTEPHPFIVQSFSDPQTGQFNANEVKNFVRNIDMMEPQVRQQWLMIEQMIRDDRKQNKYSNLIKKSVFVPEFFVENGFLNENLKFDFYFIAKSYDEIDDENISVGDRDIRKAYEDSKHLFKQDHTRSIEYVTVPVYATEEDKQELKNEILELKEEFSTVSDVERFINAVSDVRMDTQYYEKEDLPSEIDSVMFYSSEGTIYGPYEKDNAFIVAMLNDIQFRPDSMNASHVLITHAQTSSGQQQQIARTYDEAEQKADSVYNVLKNNPQLLPEIAVEISDDPSAAMNQGTLEWFKDGDMVPEFNEAVVEGNIGDIVKVESQFGFHIIHIKDKSPLSKKVQVAKIIRNIRPSDETYRSVYREVSEFAAKVHKKRGSLEEIAAEKGYSVRQSERTGKMDNTLPGIQRARPIIQWAFNVDTKEGETSEIFDFEDQFVLAKLNSIRKEGVPKLKDIEDQIRDIALKNKKFEVLSESINKLQKENKSLEDIAKELQVEVNFVEQVNFLTTTLPGFGRESKVFGAAFALPEKHLSEPIKGNNNVFIIKVVNKSDVILPENFSEKQIQMNNQLMRRIENGILRAIENNAEIIDNRFMFY